MRSAENSISGRITLICLIFFTLFHFSEALSNEKFIIFSSSDELREQSRLILEASYQEISQSLQDSLSRVVTVYIADTDEEFRERAGNSFPDWGIGCAVPSHHLIVLKSPARFKYGKSLNQLLRHELAHIFLGAKVKPGNMPRWLDEGFAMMHSHEWTLGQDIVVARAVLTNSVFPLTHIERLNSFQESKANLAYTLSFLAVSYLIREYGRESLVDAVQLLSQDKNWNEVFLETTGSKYRDFQREFLDSVKARYRWISFLGDTFFFWLGLALLVVFVYLLKRRHTRRILKRWEDEEKGVRYESETD